MNATVPRPRWSHPLQRAVAMAAAVVSVLAAGFATGCARTIDGRYAPPAIRVPAGWAASASASAPAASASALATAPEIDAATGAGRWWSAFGDPALDRLVADAFAANNDLAVAALRVREAQLQAGLADAALHPNFAGSGLSADTSRVLGGPARGTTVRSGTITLGPSFEVDLWNRLGSLRDIARWTAEATEQDRASTAQALAGTTATLYWQLGYLGQRIANGAQSVAYAERTVALVQAQYRAGATSALEVSEAEQTVAVQRAAQTTLVQQRSVAGTSLALLFDGRRPDVASQVPDRLPDGPPPPVRPGLPVSLLTRRPDLRAAELRLRGSFASIDATRASYYPAFTLNASVGGSSTSLGEVLRNPVGTLGAGLTLPFLNINDRRLNIAVSETQYAEAVTTFRQTLYQALTDVDNALSAREADALQAVELERSLAASRNAERLYEIRYRLGNTTLRTWLDAQERRRTAENALVDNRYNRLVDHATLLRVLGGGVE